MKTQNIDFSQAQNQAQNIGNLNGESEYQTKGSLSRLYQFSLKRSSRMSVGLEGAGSSQLLKEDGTEIRSRKSTRLKSGTYYVQVEATGDYTLKLKGRGRASDAGDALGEAMDLGLLSGSSRTLRQRVGGRSDRQDFYQIELAEAGEVNLALGEMRRDADLLLLNENGDEITRSATEGDESIRQRLEAGVYFVQVSPFGSRMKYALTMESGGSEGNGIGGENKGNLGAVFSQSGTVSSGKSNFYRFNTGQSGVFTADLTGLTGDADVRLVQDKNNNNVIDSGEVLAWQWERGTASESIRKFIGAGDYALQVVSYGGQTATYQVKTNFVVAASDSQKFSIQLNFGTGLESINGSVRDAIAKAAKVWENVISYSSFNNSHTLSVDVMGESVNDNWYAAATNKQGTPDGKNNWMPTTGRVRINTNYASTFNRNPEYLTSILTHEFAHILGIGTLWENNGRKLIDYSSDTYVADSYAGLAYGELKGTQAIAIPLSKDKDAAGKTIYGHWSESYLGDELLTPEAEGAGLRIPLSQLTIASLRDIGWNVNYGAAEAFSLGKFSTPENNTISSLPPGSNDLFIRCGCSYHLSQSAQLNAIGSTRLIDLIGVG
jgi:hypothetical protein